MSVCDVAGLCSVISVSLLSLGAGLVVLLVRKTSLILPAGDFDRLEDWLRGTSKPVLVGANLWIGS